MKTFTVSDYDGTLCTDGGEIHPYALRMIKEYTACGNYFSVCTGRTFQGFHRYSPDIINAPVLLANGAAAYDYEKKEYVFFDGLGEECFEFIRRVRDDFPSVSIEMYCKNGVWAVNINESTLNHFRVLGIDDYKTASDPSETEGCFAKVMLACENGNGDTVPFNEAGITGAGASFEIQKILGEKYKNINYLPTTGRWVEVLKKGVDKGAGLLKLASLIGIKADRTAAIGDGYNDVDMLKAAAFSFVPANGCPEAKAAAKTEVPSNNDGGVGRALKMMMTRADRD